MAGVVAARGRRTREELMGGLAAVVHWDGAPCGPGEVSAVLRASPHRAPDGTTEWTSGAVALGHQRFITTPEQHVERQPLVDEEAALAFVFDGRLDNRQALASELGLAGAPSLSDAAIACAAFRRWGHEAARRLLGDFAFVAWDARNRRVTAARDHMGVRHLHFFSGPGLFVCATDAAQVLAHAAVPREPDLSIAADYLACDVRNVPGTLYRHVSRVLPGHVLTASEGKTDVSRYWAAEPSVAIRYRSDREYAEHCRDLLVTAVDARLRADRPAAAMLSGGLDSSSVVTIAHRLVAGRGERPQPFSMIFPDRPEADERRFIDAVAAKCGVEPVLVTPGPITAAALQRQAHAWNGTPAMPADEMAGTLYAAIAARGHRVALTGAAGDFLFTGSVFQYADLLRAFRPLQALRRFVDDWRADDTGRSALGLIQAGAWPLLPARAKQTLRPLAKRLMGIGEHPEWLRLERAPEGSFPDRPRGGSYATEDVTRLLSCGMHFFFVECAERAAAQAGIELRHPFLDVRVVQFALDIPDEQRKHGPYPKYVLRQALAGELPDEVRLRRTKASFGYSIVEALDALGGEAFFRTMSIADAGWIDPDAIVRKFQVMRRAYARGGEGYGDHIPALWMVAAVEIWHRAAFAGRAAA